MRKVLLCLVCVTLMIGIALVSLPATAQTPAKQIKLKFATHTEACNLTCPIDPKQVWKNVGEIPLHRGAERYYREHGLM